MMSDADGPVDLPEALQTLQHGNAMSIAGTRA
jgi:hypothetical protein